MIHPWTCVKLIPGGAVNKVGLTNKGIDWWLNEVVPNIDFKRYKIIVSLYGKTDHEITALIRKTSHLDICGYEVNVSCPNSGHAQGEAGQVIEIVREAHCKTILPLIVKVSVAQDYLAIADGLRGVAQAISLNTVPWEKAFPGKRSPLWRLQNKLEPTLGPGGGGGGGVSGKPAQNFNWPAVKMLANQGALPVIAPDLMEYGDIDRVQNLGASAFSFGTIHMPSSYWQPWTLVTNPLKPTQFVEREKRIKEILNERLTYANK
jgi:dihydroorotate dehydrogenase